MAEIATAFVSIMPSFKGAGAAIGAEITGATTVAANSPGVDEAGKKAGKKFGSGMGSSIVGMGKKILGPLAAVAGAAAVASFAKGAIQGAGDLQQSIGAVQTVFGDSSKQMLGWSKTANQSVGLTQNEFNSLGTLIGSQLKNGGTAMEELAPKTQSLIGLGADLSSMFGGTTAEAVGALSSALKGERDPIEKYGVSLTQAKIDAKAAELGFSKVGGSFDSTATQAATLALIMDQTADATGNFAKEGDTLQGQQARLSAGWSDFQATLGTALVPVLTEVTGWFNTLVQKLEPVTKWISDNPKLVSILVVALGGLAVVLAAVAAVTWLVNLAFWANPVTWIVVGIVALIAALILLWQNWDAVVAWLTGVWAGFVTWLGEQWAEITGAIETAWNAIADFFTDIWNSIVSGLTSAWNGVVSFLTGVWNAIINFGMAVWNGYINFYIGLWNIIRDAVVAAWNGISSFLTGIWNAIVSTAKTIWSGLTSFISEIPGNILSYFSNALTMLKDVGADIIQGLINGITGAVSGAVRAVKDAVGSIVDGAKSLLGIASPSTVFRAIGLDTGLGLEIGLRESEAGAMSAMRSLVVNPTKAAVNNLDGVAGHAFPASVTLVDASGGILTHARVVADQAIGDTARATDATRQTRARTF